MKSDLKICMLAPEFYPVWGGVGTYIVGLVRHLPNDVEVHVVTLRRKNFGKEEASTSDYNCLEYFGTNVHVHFVCKASDTFFYNGLFQYSCLRNVPKIMKRNKIDILHSHTAQMPDLLLAFRKLGKPIVTTVHTVIKSQRLGTKASNQGFLSLERSEKATLVLYPILRLAEEMYFRKKRFCVTPSNWMKRFLEDNYHVEGNIRVIPNSVDVSYFDESKKCSKIIENIISKELRNRRIVLYSGRLLAMKGVDTLIRSIPEVRKEFGKDELLFVFAGPGDYTRYINELKNMKIEHSCIFTGSLDKTSIIQLLMSAELAVVPSFHENSPFAVLESMACGTPVIASDVGGISEIIKNGYNGILVQAGSVKALAKAIINLLEDKSLQSSIRLRAKETISKEFSWSVNIKKYLEVYTECAQYA